MKLTLALALLVASVLLGNDAAAQVPPAPMAPPKGTDDVALIRLYRRASGTTEALGKLGLVLARTPVERAVPLSVNEAGRAGGTLHLSARRVSKGAELEWELLRDGSPPSKGRSVVESGTLGHVVLGEDGEQGGGQLFASVEAGRAADFQWAQLASHFGGAPAGTEMRAAAPLPPDAVPIPPQPPSWGTHGPWVGDVAARTAPRAGAPLAIHFTLTRGGEPVGSPLVNAKDGERFVLDTHSLVDPARGRNTSRLTIGGVANLSPVGDSVDLELSIAVHSLVQAGGVTSLIERYRDHLTVPVGREIELELFDGLDKVETRGLQLQLLVERKR